MNKNWFRARKGLRSKDMGWGFIPISREGIAAYLVLLAVITALGFFFNILNPTNTEGVSFLISALAAMGLFSLIVKSKNRT